MRVMLRMAVLVVIVVSVVPETKLGGHHSNRLASIVLLVAMVGSWVTWLRSRDHRDDRVTLVSLIVLGAAGGALTPIAPASIAVAAAVGVGTVMAFGLTQGLLIASVGPLACLISAGFLDHDLILTPVVAGAALGGALIGVARNQAQLQVEQRAQLDLERERTQLEHEQAELLGERNRLAREIHDVLAHTLGAVSVQIEALDAMIGREEPEALRGRLQATRGLVVQGLAEARRAVSALRDDAPPLTQQLKELCAGGEAELVIDGQERPLTTPASLALFRIAQEALTNAAKHAPGSAVAITLRYEPGTVDLSVHNNAGSSPPGPLATQGGGYGLQGMRERVLLLGGTLEAGPVDDGWLVRARLHT
jgi:signal transduction histidine kinase